MLACAVRLLDRGFFRIGTEDYAETNKTFGLATMRRRHVTLGEETSFASTTRPRAASGASSPWSTATCSRWSMRSCAVGPVTLLAYKEGRRWVDVASDDINAYIKEVTEDGFSAKDFRTWNATVLAAVALAVSGAAHGSKTGRTRAITRAVKEVAHYLEARRPSAAPPTSTLGSSTASGTGSRSAARWRSSAR